jgi:hypothetical protein
MGKPENDADVLAYMGTDGLKWSEEFLKLCPPYTHPNYASAVHSWFANAIEAGKSAGYSSAFEEMKHAAKNLGFDTSEVYTPGQLIEFVHTFRGDLQ